MRYLTTLFLSLLCLLPLQAENPEKNMIASHYRDLANQYMNLPEEVGYLEKALEISIINNDYKEQCDIYKALTRNNFNRWVSDSISYWGEIGIPLARKHKLYSNMFDMMSLICFQHLFSGKYEIATDEDDNLNDVCTCNCVHIKYFLMA